MAISSCYYNREVNKFLEKILYKAKNKIFSGAILNILTLSTTFIVSLFLARIGYVIEIFFLFTTLATKSLADEGKKVYRILKSGDIEKAKKNYHILSVEIQILYHLIKLL